MNNITNTKEAAAEHGPSEEELITNIVVNLSFLRLTLMSISEATPEKGFLAMDTFERPLSIVASENNKVTLRKERFTTILAMKSR